jgi:hypothetical protein
MYGLVQPYFNKAKVGYRSNVNVHDGNKLLLLSCFIQLVKIHSKFLDFSMLVGCSVNINGSISLHFIHFTCVTIHTDKYITYYYLFIIRIFAI